MNPETINGHCDEIDHLTALIRTEAATPTPPDPRPPLDVTLVEAGADLQAVLAEGGSGLYVLAAGETFARGSGFQLATPQVALSGAGETTLAAETAPAVTVPVGMQGVFLGNLGLQASRSEVVVLLGRNDSQQTTVAQAPRRIVCRRLVSSGHRGKRVVEVNAREVYLADLDVRDAYDPEQLDSQAICMLNAPGPLLVEDSYLEGASETFMCGGDTMKIPGVRPSGITFRRVKLTKYPAWRTQGIKVKNIFELKDGHHVLIEECELWFCWKSGQDGYCFMFTPSNGGSLRNVVVKTCQVWDVGGIVNITGTDASGINPERTQVSVLGGEYRTNVGAMGGTGRYALITRGPEWFITEGAVIAHEGASFIDCADQAPIDRLHILNSTWNYGSYGVRIGGRNHGDNSLGLVDDLRIEGNTISGAHSQFKERYPHNTYVDGYVQRHRHPYSDEEWRWIRPLLDGD